MNFADIQVRLRPRAGWEAVDLGCALVRRFARPVWATLAVGYLPLMVLVTALLWQRPGWTLLALWWLKPLASRLVLRVLSTSLFGQTPPLRQRLAELPRLLTRDLWGLLVVRRIRLMRSFELPLFELEGKLDPARRRQRLGSLQTLHGCADKLTFTSLLLEGPVFYGLFSFGMLMVPGSVFEGWGESALGMGLSPWLDSMQPYFQVCSLVTILTYLLVEPFYTGAGFLLYLNARTMLEGWDIELDLRRLQQRLADLGLVAPAPAQESTLPPPLPPPGAASIPPAVPTRGLAPLLLAALLPLLLFLPTPTAARTGPSLGPPPGPEADAQPAASAPASPPGKGDGGAADARTPAQRAAEILRQPEFEIHREKVPVARMPSTELPGGGLFGFFGALSSILNVLLVLAVLGLLVWLLIQLIGHSRRAGGGAPGVILPRRGVTQLAGLDLRPSSLPDDIVAAARRAWAAGDPREALSLLYRGALSWLLFRGRLPIVESDTEGDCLRRLSRHPPLAALLPWMIRLNAVWIPCAYDRRAPAAAEFDELCRSWPFVAGFVPAPAPAVASSAGTPAASATP